jgi:membrane-bound lytic murein transglycosylase B
MQRITAALFFALICTSAFAQSSGVNKQFRNWLETSLWPKAQAEGISRGTFDAALGNV